jgi:hypothetical protein
MLNVGSSGIGARQIAHQLLDGVETILKSMDWPYKCKSNPNGAEKNSWRFSTKRTKLAL